ncbi:gemin2 [Holotrichia oblita]|uniref:Gemin2 n=1 Tax=Holotrichia oblita TaxID=644536 RepID=A0ACB9T666_HOLOL|nr:gemin2 [Holotrichia oblita]
MFDEFEESSSDEDCGMLKKALDVSLPEDFDPNIVPQNGEEYLQLVMYEAKQCKKWVAVNVDRSKLKQPTLKIDMIENCDKAPLNMLPSQEWQKDKLKDFSNLRLFLEDKITESPELATIQDNLWIDRISTEVAKFSTIDSLSQGGKVRLLQIILEQLEKIEAGDTIGYETGTWLYGILATLGVPLCPHACHCLRELARRCSKIRSSLAENSSEDKYINLNLFICIVAKYFKQLDLAD